VSEGDQQDPASDSPDAGETPASGGDAEGSGETPASETETSEAGEASGEPPEGDLLSAEQVTVEVTNIYHGNVTIEDGRTVGFAVGGTVPRDSGMVPEAAIEAIARLYLKPEAFHTALRSLRKNHLVILVGAEGSGRFAGSIMLAGTLRDPATPIMRCPPTRTLAELGGQTFKKGQCSVLRDWIPTATSGVALTSFDAEHLSQRLRGAGAYLIITRLAGSLSSVATAAFEEHWSPPDPAALFDHCFDRVDKLDGVAEALPALRERAAQLGCPRHVVHLARQLCDGVEQALLTVDDSVERDVTAWFEEKPSRRAIRAAVILTFACRAGDEPDDAPGVGQRGFEHLFALLEQAEAEYRGDQPPEVAEPPDEGEEFPQERHHLLAYANLAPFTVEPPARPVVGIEHRPGFRTAAQRDLFMAELVRRYGDELWSPVHAWLAEAIAPPYISDAHLAIAYGIGRMARYDANEVQDAYLEQWAAGRMAERYCAVFTLWSMAAHEDLAPLALARVRDWVWGRGTERAIVAAITFGGALGKRYPIEAMWWLWRLAMRGQRISLYARVAIGNLLTIDAASNDPVVARFLLKKTKPLLLPGAQAAERRTALSVVEAALSVSDADGKTPGIVKVLRECPAALAPIGELWSGVLRSAPHRAGGIAVLHRTLKALENAPDGMGIAVRLGREILPALSPPQRTQVELGLRKLSAPEETRKKSAIVAAFLNLPPDAQTPPAGSVKGLS
jgi:hypothetical protein